MSVNFQHWFGLLVSIYVNKELGFCIRHLMSYSLVIHLQLSISKYLVVNSISKEMIPLESFILYVMKGYFLVIQLKAKHIDVITKDYRELWRELMSRWMSSTDVKSELMKEN